MCIRDSINPSVELTANVFDRVIGVKAMNSDGQKLLQTQNIKNKAVNEGVAQLLKNAEGNGYLLDNSTNAVLLSVSSKDSARAEKIEMEVANTATQQLESLKIGSQIVTQKLTLQEHDCLLYTSRCV